MTVYSQRLFWVYIKYELEEEWFFLCTQERLDFLYACKEGVVIIFWVDDQMFSISLSPVLNSCLLNMLLRKMIGM